jgi:shikimate dehydrogenase
VIGHPVAHSLSPALHNAAFAAAGLDWVYVALDVEPGAVADAFAGVRALGIAGLSVTMPHKEAAAAAADELTDDARRLGAVNCVVNRRGALVGHNTDGPGLLAALDAEVGYAPHGARCVVLGAGGAARAVVLALARADAAEVAVVNRTPDRAAAAAALAGDRGVVVAPAAAGARLAAADLVVNATPVGMGEPAAADVPFDLDHLRPGQVVADLVYRPLVTPLVAGARDRGVTAVNGLGMLVHQAALAFELWTGVDAPLDVMTGVVEAAVGAADDPPDGPAPT